MSIALQATFAISEQPPGIIPKPRIGRFVEDAGMLISPGPHLYLALPGLVAVALHDGGVVTL